MLHLLLSLTLASTATTATTTASAEPIPSTLQGRQRSGRSGKGRGAGRGSGQGGGRSKGGAKRGGGGRSKFKLVFSERYRRTRAEHSDEEEDPSALLAPTPRKKRVPETSGKKGGAKKKDGKQKIPPYLLADDEEIVRLHGVADWDENGWISFSEAERSMHFDRLRFAAYDTDRDGRLILTEFKGFVFDSLRRNAKFEAPKPRPDASRPPPRTAEQLRNAYDRDLDESVSLFELGRLLEDYGRTDLEPEQLVVADDLDGDGRLALGELGGVVALLYPVSSSAVDEAWFDGEAVSLLELFRRVVPRETVSGIAPPPLIQGPVPPFHRLDLDNDGAITEEDLRALLRPIPESVRLGSVLGILDLDGDGVLNVTEFEQALGATDS